MTALRQLAPNLHPAEWVRLLAGPIFDKELRVASRRRWSYLLRAAYLVLLGVFVVLVWGTVVGSSGSRAFASSRLSQAGATVVVTIVWFQFLAAQLVAAITLSAAVGEEVRRRTLGVLLSTPITGLQIVAGKLAAGMLRTGLLVAVSLPLLALVRVFGGVPWGFVVAGLCLTLAMGLFTGAVSLYLSIGAGRASGVAFLTLLLVGLVFLVLPYALIIIGMRSSPGQGDPPVVVLLALVDPYISLLAQSGSLMATSGGPSALCVEGWKLSCPLAVAGSAVLVLLSARKVRRAASVALVPGSRAKGAGGGRIRRITGSPVAWREVRTRLVPSRAAAVLIVVGLAAITIVVYILDCRGFPELADFHPSWLVGLVVLGLLTTLVTAVGGITTEKEAGTWPLVLVTPMSASRVLFGKVVGILRRSGPVWVLPAAYLCVYAATEEVQLLVVWHAALVALSLFVFAVGLGLLAGVLSRRTTTGIVLALGLAAAVLVAIPMGVHYMENAPGMCWALLAPDVEPYLSPLGMMHVVAGKWLHQSIRGGFSFMTYGPQDDAVSVLKGAVLTCLLYSAVGLYLAGLAGVKLRKRIT